MMTITAAVSGAQVAAALADDGEELALFLADVAGRMQHGGYGELAEFIENMTGAEKARLVILGENIAEAARV